MKKHDMKMEKKAAKGLKAAFPCSKCDMKKGCKHCKGGK